MHSDLKKAISAWNDDVDDKAAQLIRGGIAPWDAMERAAKIVSARREREAIDRLIERKRDDDL